MRHIAIVAAIVVSVAISGCSSQKSQVVGTWKVQVQQPNGATNDPAAALGNAFGNAFANIIFGPLEMKADNSFVTTMAGVVVSGTWSISGSTVTLNFKQATIPNASAGAQSQPLILTLSPDGKTMTGKESQNSLIFVKE